MDQVSKELMKAIFENNSLRNFSYWGILRLQEKINSFESVRSYKIFDFCSIGFKIFFYVSIQMGVLNTFSCKLKKCFFSK